MNFYKYLFNWIYNLALKNSNDNTPEYTAFFFLSQLIIFNLLTILSITLNYVRISLDELVTSVFVVSIFVIFVNYRYCIYKKQKNISVINYSIKHNFSIIIYIILTFILFFKSISVIVPIN